MTKKELAVLNRVNDEYVRFPKFIQKFIYDFDMGKYPHLIGSR